MCVMGPSICVMWASVIGKVAMRVHMDTWASSERSPDRNAASSPVPNATNDEIRCVVALDCTASVVS